MGDKPEELRMQVYVDADCASGVRTPRSTSGVVSLLKGIHTICMLSACSRIQTSVSHSAPEADIVAADAPRSRGVVTPN